MPEYTKELSPEENILNQARTMNKNLMGVPTPPKTDNTLNDFIIQALMQAPMALGRTMNSPAPSISSQALASSNGVNRGGPNMYNPLRYQFIGKPSNNNANLKPFFTKGE